LPKIDTGGIEVDHAIEILGNLSCRHKNALVSDLSKDKVGMSLKPSFADILQICIQIFTKFGVGNAEKGVVESLGLWVDDLDSVFHCLVAGSCRMI